MSRDRLALYLAVFMLAIGPFFNGMFFEPVRLVGVVLAGAACLLSLSRDSRTPAWRDALTLALLAWLGAYVIVSPWAVYPRGHLSALLDLSAVAAVYVAVRQRREWEPFLRLTLIVSGLIMTLVGVASLSGLTVLDRIFVNLVYHGRLSGGFQYPNTFSAWLFVLTFLVLPQSDDRRLGPWLRAAGGVFAAAFMLTLSRGGLVATPPAFLALWLLAPREDRLRLVVLVALTWGPALLLGNLSLARFLAGHELTGWLLLALSALPPAVAPSREQLAKATAWLRSHRLGAAVAAALVVVTALVVLRQDISGLLVQHLPMGERRSVASFTFTDPNVVLRLTYNMDALRIALQRHFIGAGGGGWSRLYQAVQNYYYSTTETHDQFAQTAVEAGLPGLLALVAVFCSALWTGIRARRLGAAGDVVPAWLGAAIFIGAHSALDFDLSFFSLLVLLAVCLGIVAGRLPADTPGAPAFRTGMKVLAAVSSCVAIILTLGIGCIRVGDAAWSKGNLTAAAGWYKAGAILDPLHPMAHERMANLALANVPGIRLPDAHDSLLTASRLDPRFFVYKMRLASLASDRGQWAEAAALASEALALNPMDAGNNEAAAELLWRSVRGALQSGNRAQATQLAAEFVGLQAGMDERIARSQPYLGIWTGQMEYTPVARLRVGQGLTVAGRWADAESQLRAALGSPSLQAEASQWLYAAYHLAGDGGKAQELRAQNPAGIQEFERSDIYKQIRALNGLS